MSVRISQLLDPSRVVLDLRATKRTAAINEVARRLEGRPEMLNFAAFYAEVLARDRADTTYIGNEVALPHARTDHANAILMAAGRSKEGIWFENCSQTVRLVFVLATPKACIQEYLQAVGSLCRLLKGPGVRGALLAAATAEEFHAVLTAAECRPAVVM
jgi:mannitol/fructose-specific phosphotransferase system IIA component (Ntr-type)